MTIPTAHRDQGGFSLIELVVVLMILSVFMAMAVPVFASLNNSAATTTSRATTVGDVQNALEVIGRDVRAANPINQQSSIGSYDMTVSFTVYCSQAGVGSCGANNLRSLSYQLVSNQLQQVTSTQTRAIVGPAGPSTLAAGLQRDAVINTSSQPVFTYYDKNGSVLATSGVSATTPANVSNCTKAVKIHLVVVSQANSTTNPVDLQTTVNLRNFNVVNPC